MAGQHPSPLYPSGADRLDLFSWPVRTNPPPQHVRRSGECEISDAERNPRKSPNLAKGYPLAFDLLCRNPKSMKKPNPEEAKLIKSLELFYPIRPQARGLFPVIRSADSKKKVGSKFIKIRSIPCSRCPGELQEAIAYRWVSNSKHHAISLLGRMCFTCHLPDMPIDAQAFDRL